MKIKFLADENLRRAIVLGLRRREPSANFVQAYEAGAAGKDDLTVLRIAAEQNRILVSHDLKTVPQHFRHFIARQASPGVILIPQQLSLSTAIEQLVLIWLASEAEEWVNQIRFLPL
jgi:predicted nuclease of predicted toxin-antitoxin system